MLDCRRSKYKYVQISEEELEALEAEANRSIDLKEFVPLESVGSGFTSCELTRQPTRQKLVC